MTRGRLLWGVVAALAYVGAAFATARSGLVPVRPLYDGFAPPAPYRWVSPPRDLAADNIPPEPLELRVDLTPDRSSQWSIATADNQAVLIAEEKTFAPRPDETALVFSITPLDPERTGLVVPQGLRLDGNAYRIGAAYGSGEPARLDGTAQVLLRYPAHASTLLLRSGGGWKELRTTQIPAALQVFADTTDLGTFVAAGPPPPFPWRRYLLIGALGAAGAIAGYLSVRIRRGRRRDPRAARRREARAGARGMTAPRRGPWAGLLRWLRR